ncbi:MAG: 3D domain-containing protein [Lachnospiraceae bacterium]|nr:3D domain-containing protein [Lachnospiraceae bacterium]
MLKCKSICASLILMISLLLGSAMTTYGSQPNGYFDEFEGNTIVGWGWDSSAPNTATPVRILVTNKDTSELVGDFHPTAAIFRKDLKENGIGNGNHGFRITMNWDSLPDGTYLIEGRIDGKEFGNTRTYTKGEAAAQAAAADESKTTEGAAATGGMRSLGVFRTTGYCPCYQCSEGWGRRTCTGATARSSHTIAVDPRIIPYGSKIMIGGVVYTAEDRGGGVKGNHVDIFFDSHSQTRQHGSRAEEVFLITN